MQESSESVELFRAERWGSRDHLADVVLGAGCDQVPPRSY